MERDNTKNEINKSVDDFDENNAEKSKKWSFRIRIILGLIIALVIIILLALYTTNQTFRNTIDANIFGKQVEENSSNVIELATDDNPDIFAYDKYIGIFSNSNFKIYNKNAVLVQELTLNIASPIIETNGKNVIIAEEGGKSFYVIKGTDIVWQGKIDGTLSKVNINNNGYVSVIYSNSTYNSIVALYNSNGTELFKVYMPSTYVMATAVSTNNSYLAIGEIDYSGTVLKSYIRVMSIKDAETVYTYEAENNNIITNMKYFDKDSLICSLTESVVIVDKDSTREIYTITDDTCFVDINLKNSLAVLEKQSLGLFSYEYDLKLISLNSVDENIYILSNSLSKSLIASEKLISLNYGNEVDIINKHGSLKKHFLSNQQIKNVVSGTSIVGIVYKDKVEIIDV